MNPPLSTSHAPALVALAYLISAAGAFVALTAAPRIVADGRRISLLNALATGAALGGIGVWAMHFVGMLSLRVELGISYSVWETLLSLVAAVLASAAALAWVARRPVASRVLTAGVLLGLGVCVMHYLGMLGMRFGGYFEWHWEWIAASVVIAIAAAMAALALAFGVRTVSARIGASLVMAGAVCAMHYTGMAAADFVCSSATPLNFPTGDWLVRSLDLPAMVSIAAFGMAFVIFVDQMLQRLAEPRGARRAPARVMARRRVPQA